MRVSILPLIILTNLIAEVNCQPPSTNTIIIAVCGTVGTFVVIIGGYCLIKHCWKKCNPEFRGMDVLQANYYNVVDMKSMTQVKFEKNKQLIVNGLNGKNKNFTFFHKKLPYEIKVSKVTVKNVKPFLTSFSLWQAIT